jgi:hypothetical protein
MQESLSTKAFEAFREACAAPPSLNLRAGYALDSYQEPPPFDATLDEATDSYLEQYTFWGLAHLDAGSWRHYLPRLIQYAILHPHDPHMVVEGLLNYRITLLSRSCRSFKRSSPGKGLQGTPSCP